MQKGSFTGVIPCSVNNVLNGCSLIKIPPLYFVTCIIHYAPLVWGIQRHLFYLFLQKAGKRYSYCSFAHEAARPRQTVTCQRYPSEHQGEICNFKLAPHRTKSNTLHGELKISFWKEADIAESESNHGSFSLLFTWLGFPVFMHPTCIACPSF